jgi:hypothetical protein
MQGLEIIKLLWTKKPAHSASTSMKMRMVLVPVVAKKERKLKIERVKPVRLKADGLFFLFIKFSPARA